VFNAYWYDPRTGEARRAEQVRRQGRCEFTPPAVWPDWVLALDDAERAFPVPGTQSLLR
jgi:hypothetical protein